MDTIFIRDLRIDTVIGLFDWERRIRQRLSFDLELGADIRAAAASDAISETCNYKEVAERLIAFVGESRFELVETLAERAAALLLEEFSLPWLRLSVTKLGAVRGTAGVGITIERGSRG